MPIGDQDHCRVAMAVATILASAVHEPLDLTFGEIASFDCQVYDVWSAFLGSRFHADKPCLRCNDCLAYTPFLHSPRSEGRNTSGVMQDGGPGQRRRHKPRGWHARRAPR